jgi:hypothetical protein
VILAVAVWAAVSMDSVLPIQVDEEPEGGRERMKSIDKRMIRKADTLELGNNSTRGTRDGKGFGSANESDSTSGDSESGRSRRSERSRRSQEERKVESGRRD